MSALTTVIAWHAPKSATTTLHMALALTELVAAEGGARAANRALQAALDGKHMLDADGKPVRALSNKRIGWYVAAAAEHPDDATAFQTAYRALAAADRTGAADKRAAKVAAEPTEDTSSRGGTSSRTVPQGNTATVDDAIRTLWEMVEAFGGQPAFDAAIRDAAAFVAPVVLIASKVAA